MSEVPPGELNRLVSIVIPCREIDALITRCIEACRRVCPESQIVVVADKASNPPAGVHVLRGSEDSPAGARNLAIRHVTTPFIAMIDSDAFPHPGWPANAVAILKREPGIGAVGGPCLSPLDESLSERVVGNASRSVLVSGRQTFRRRLAPARDCPHLSSCNLVVRYEDYVAVGGMDEKLYTGEDMDFGTRLLRHGLRVRFDPAVVVYHRNRTLRGLFLQRLVWGLDSAETMVQSRFRSLPEEAISAVWLLFLACGTALIGLPGWRWCYIAPVGCYVVACLVETLRFSANLREWPGTFLALLVGNMAPGLGVLARLVGISPNRRRIYYNNA